MPLRNEHILFLGDEEEPQNVGQPISEEIRRVLCRLLEVSPDCGLERFAYQPPKPIGVPSIPAPVSGVLST